MSDFNKILKQLIEDQETKDMIAFLEKEDKISKFYQTVFNNFLKEFDSLGIKYKLEKGRYWEKAIINDEIALGFGKTISVLGIFTPANADKPKYSWGYFEYEKRMNRPTAQEIHQILDKYLKHKKPEPEPLKSKQTAVALALPR